MASTLKQFLAGDKTSVRTPLYESMPMTGSLWDGTDYPALDNIKTYSHGIFESVYDYPFLSSSANHLFDISFGFASSSIYNTTGVVDADKKINMYNQMCQMLMGFDDDGVVKPLTNPETGAEMKEVFIISLSRLVYKDEVKKGSLDIDWCDEAYADVDCAAGEKINFTESGSYHLDSPVGEYSSVWDDLFDSAHVGMLFYQAGILLLSGTDSIAGREANGDGDTFGDLFTSGSIDDISDAWLYRACKINVVNTTELNSQIYFLRAHNNEFNYSTNPTYVEDSKIRVKDVASDPSIAYVTGAGLFSAQGELLATAKLSEPLKKTSGNEVTLRCRLDW